MRALAKRVTPARRAKGNTRPVATTSVDFDRSWREPLASRVRHNPYFEQRSGWVPQNWKKRHFHEFTGTDNCREELRRVALHLS